MRKQGLNWISRQKSRQFVMFAKISLSLSFSVPRLILLRARVTAVAGLITCLSIIGLIRVLYTR